MHREVLQGGDQTLSNTSEAVPLHTDEARVGRPTATLWVAVLTVLGFVLRFWRLGNWSLDSDEVFMLRDSVHFKLTNPRPLMYGLNHYLVAPFFPLDEWGLRLMPALFGGLAIPIFYLVARRLVGSRAALFGTLLLTVSPLLVYYSQFARYWTLVFLLCSVYPYALYVGLREPNLRALIVGFITGVLASLAHPSSVILTGGLAIWFLATHITRAQVARLWGQKSVRWGTLVVLVLLPIMAIRFIPMVTGWIYRRPKLNTFLFHTPNRPGLRELSYLLSFVESTTVPLALAAMAGLYFLWRMRDRSFALLLISLFGFQLLFLMLIRTVAPASTFYLVPALPVFFVGAGVFLDRLATLEMNRRPSWLFTAIMTGSIVVAGAPTLVSQYFDGRRFDFRTVARWLNGPLSPQDVIFSDQSYVLAHYLKRDDVQPLTANPARLEEALRGLGQSGASGVMWIVAPASSHAFRTNPNLGALNRWVYDHCQLRNTVGVGRVDFRQQYLDVFRCQRE